MSALSSGTGLYMSIIVHAVGVRFLGVRLLTLVFLSRLEPIRIYANRCFEYDAEMTVRKAHG